MNIGNILYTELRGDRVIWAIVAFLSIFSILAVYSSTGAEAYRLRDGNTEFYLLKHVVILAFGLFLMYLAYLMHYMKYNQAAPYLLLIAIPLLVYTIAMGENYNDARRWIAIPYVGLTFQTSDFAKLSLIIYVARELTKKQEYIKDFNSAFLPIIVPILIICGLIAPADLSTAILVFITCLMMMFIGRVDVKFIALLLLLGLVVFLFLAFLGQVFPEFIRSETWISRITDYWENPEGSYQIQQAKIAIANGQWIGLGPGNSIQRNFLPSPYSDFIYAIICEEYGFIGAIIIMSVYIFLFVRATRLVTKSQKAFGAMVAMGLSMSLVIQALINMAVSVHLVPVTGQTMPLISMGGSSMLFTCISFGIILSVSKYIEKTAS